MERVEAVESMMRSLCWSHHGGQFLKFHSWSIFFSDRHCKHHRPILAMRMASASISAARRAAVVSVEVRRTDPCTRSRSDLFKWRRARPRIYGSAACLHGNRSLNLPFIHANLLKQIQPSTGRSWQSQAYLCSLLGSIPASAAGSPRQGFPPPITKAISISVHSFLDFLGHIWTVWYRFRHHVRRQEPHQIAWLRYVYIGSTISLSFRSVLFYHKLRFYIVIIHQNFFFHLIVYQLANKNGVQKKTTRRQLFISIKSEVNIHFDTRTLSCSQSQEASST